MFIMLTILPYYCLPVKNMVIFFRPDFHVDNRSGDGGIRTHGAAFTTLLFSKQAH